MEPYAPLVSADPFARSVSAFESLTRTLSGDTASAWTHAELEEHLNEVGRELLRQLFQDHLDLRARREQDLVRSGVHPPVIGSDGRLRPWREPGHARWLACLFGLVRVDRVAHRSCGAANVHPADESLSLPAGRHSMGLRRLAALEAVRGSFDQAQQAIERRCGRVLGKRRLEQLVAIASGDIDAFYRQMIPVPASRDVLLVLEVDGKGVVMRPEGLRPATQRARLASDPGAHRSRLAPGEKPNRKRMATVACVFDAVPASRRPHDVIHPPGGRSTARAPRPGPTAERKWCTASLIHPPEKVIADALPPPTAHSPHHPRTVL
ncbi:ISKra4 family transposase, partial [Streptomyces violascens]